MSFQRRLRLCLKNKLEACPTTTPRDVFFLTRIILREPPAIGLICPTGAGISSRKTNRSYAPLSLFLEDFSAVKTPRHLPGRKQDRFKDAGELGALYAHILYDTFFDLNMLFI